MCEPPHCFQQKADKIAKKCIDLYMSLPKNGKPEPGKEWTVLAGIVQENRMVGSLGVVAIGTGTKCIGPSKMRNDGRILHDSHGEVIARRSFLKYLYSQLETVYSSQESSIFLVDDMTGKCSVKKEILFHFYISQTPCGDASIIPVSRLEEEGDPKDEGRIKLKRKLEADEKLFPKKMKKTFNSDNALLTAKCSGLIDVLRTGGKPVSGEIEDPRGPGCNYHVTGSLRNKPGRGEATISMSCSDKIAKWNAVGCLGGLLSHFVTNPIYFQSIVLGRCCYSSESLHRALYDRILQLKLNPPYKVHLPIFAQSAIDFQDRCQKNLLPCGSSIAWCKIPLNPLGVSANGFRLGVTRKKWGTVHSQCSICKNSLFVSFLKVKAMCENKNVHFSNFTQGKKCVTYRDYKDAASIYQSAWEKMRELVFTNWLLHDRDLDNFTINE